MMTLFECWNGGSVQWDRMSPPQFAFAYPAADASLVTFFRLSGRIGEILTGTEWLLNIGGNLFDIPNLPPQEVDVFIGGVRSTMGHTPMAAPFQLGNPFSGFVTIPVALWVSLKTGRADLYNPFVGPAFGQQLLPPQMPLPTSMNVMPPPSFPSPSSSSSFAPPPAAQPAAAAPRDLAVSLNGDGQVAGGGAQSTLKAIADIATGAGQIARFLSQVLSPSHDDRASFARLTG